MCAADFCRHSSGFGCALLSKNHRRVLGNDSCTRPVERDWHFEPICESCTFFVTTSEFRPTLERRRNDAVAKGQIAREQTFDGFLHRLDGQVG